MPEQNYFWIPLNFKHARETERKENEAFFTIKKIRPVKIVMNR